MVFEFLCLFPPSLIELRASVILGNTHAKEAFLVSNAALYLTLSTKVFLENNSLTEKLHFFIHMGKGMYEI